MEIFIHIILLVPILGFIISLFITEKNEKLLSVFSATVVGLELLTILTLDVFWLMSKHPTINIEEVILFQQADYKFIVDFYFDKVSAMFITVGAILSFMVVIYSRYYLHREKGYKRYFNTILFFYFGYNLTLLSGNFETLFIGWEILGISSFLLIAFYRDRFLPVKNAIKVFSVYRLGDIGLLLAMWMSHFLWHENIPFLKLNNYELVSEHLTAHSGMGIFISMMILLAASAKSAQLPFSSWLPRAMEGPTPSSAIFYGSLSVNMGAFLLLRTFPFWEHQYIIRLIIVNLGLFTMLISTGISRVQSSIKSQIAYASIAQIGIIFIEIALGFHTIALIHFAGNAFLRTYQLLVSPSVVSYLIREQFYTYSENHKSIESSWPGKVQNTLYLLCLQEWKLDALMYELIWNPIKKVARKFNFIDHPASIIGMSILYLFGLYLLFFNPAFEVPLRKFLPVIFGFIGLIVMFRSFAERKRTFYAWILILGSHFWIALAIGLNDIFDFNQILLYLSGITISSAIGGVIIYKIRTIEVDTDISKFHGHSFEHPKLAFLFLLTCLGLTGFPITPTFIGEDLLFSHIHQNQVILASIISLSFVVDGLSVIRIYARLFLGPHVKTYHEIAYRSS